MQIEQTEIEYLSAAVNRYFKEKLRRQDLLYAFSGVRRLFDYVFDLDETGGVPLFNVFGGEITTFRKLAEHGWLYGTRARRWWQGRSGRRRAWTCQPAC